MAALAFAAKPQKHAACIRRGVTKLCLLHTSTPPQVIAIAGEGKVGSGEVHVGGGSRKASLELGAVRRASHEHVGKGTRASLEQVRAGF